MLKKAGIIVAASAAGLLAVAPLAFASPNGNGHGSGGDVEFTQTEVDSHDCVTAQDGRTTATGGGGLLNLIGGIAVGIPVQALNCNQILNNVHVLSPQIGDNKVE